MSQNLPRRRVLRGRGKFAHILGIGSVVKEGSVKLWYAPNLSLDGPKIGFAVTRALGNAVMRNRVKRCLREAARLHQNHLYGKAAFFDLILMYVGPAVKRPGQIRCKALEREVVSALKSFVRRISET